MTKRAVTRRKRKPARNNMRAEIARLRRQVKYLQLQRAILRAALKAATQGPEAV